MAENTNHQLMNGNGSVKPSVGRGRPLVNGIKTSAIAPIDVSQLLTHELLKTCKSFDDNNPDVGSLVFAKSQGFVYWPGFIVPVKEPTDSDDEGYKNAVDSGSLCGSAFIMYFEETFRVDLIPWDKVIPVDLLRLDELYNLIVQLNKLEKKKWVPNPKFQNSYEIMLQFQEIEPLNRQKAAEERCAVAKKEKKQNLKLKRERKLASGESKTIPPSSFPSNEEESTSTPRPPPPRTSTCYSFRPKILTSTHSKSSTSVPETTKKILDNDDSDSSSITALQLSKRKRLPRSDRPKEGEPLKVWVEGMFADLDKRFNFESNSNFRCAQCKEVISLEPTFCHDVPFHSKCLTPSAVLEDGVKKTIRKCSDCINLACFICKTTNEPESITKCKKCDLRFHRDCLKAWPQAEIVGSTGPLTCPLHVCHTCKAEHRLFNKMRSYNLTTRSAVRCLDCLTAYHKGSCLPAGVGGSLMKNQFLICPRHYGKETEEKKQKKTLGCFTCSKKIKKTELMLECTGCPLMYHLKCGGYGQNETDKGISLETYAADFKCEGCYWGCFPVHGQVVLYRQPGSVYWPALVSFPAACADRAVTETGFSSVMYCGSKLLNYDHARLFRSLPFYIASIEFLTKLDIYNREKPQVATAFEEALYLADVSEAYRESILPKAEPIYKKLERNLYRITASELKAKAKRDIDFEACLCGQKNKGEEVCVSAADCINRETLIECNEKNCSAGLRCKNRMFTEKRDNIEDKLEYFNTTTGKGWGVRTTVQVPKGKFLIEYVGEVISKFEKDWRVSRKMEEDPRYFFEMRGNTFIDAEYYGNLSRLINHACNPNCTTAIYTSAQGKSVAGIFAARDIEAGEELSFDYNYGKSSQICLRCQCGGDKCKKYIGDRLMSTVGLLEAGIDNPTQVQADWFKWDEECSVCNTGGNLMMCEYPGCSKVSHSRCVGLKSIPKSQWICSDHPSSSKRKLHGKGNRGKVGRPKSVSTTSKNTKENIISSKKLPHQESSLGSEPSLPQQSTDLTVAAEFGTQPSESPKPPKQTKMVSRKWDTSFNPSSSDESVVNEHGSSQDAKGTKLIPKQMTNRPRRPPMSSTEFNEFLRRCKEKHGSCFEDSDDLNMTRRKNRAPLLDISSSSDTCTSDSASAWSSDMEEDPTNGTKTVENKDKSRKRKLKRRSSSSSDLGNTKMMKMDNGRQKIVSTPDHRVEKEKKTARRSHSILRRFQRTPEGSSSGESSSSKRSAAEVETGPPGSKKLRTKGLTRTVTTRSSVGGRGRLETKNITISPSKRMTLRKPPRRVRFEENSSCGVIRTSKGKLVELRNTRMRRDPYARRNMKLKGLPRRDEGLSSEKGLSQEMEITSEVNDPIQPRQGPSIQKSQKIIPRTNKFRSNILLGLESVLIKPPVSQSRRLGSNVIYRNLMDDLSEPDDLDSPTTFDRPMTQSEIDRLKQLSETLFSDDSYESD